MHGAFSLALALALISTAEGQERRRLRSNGATQPAGPAGRVAVSEAVPDARLQVDGLDSVTSGRRLQATGVRLSGGSSGLLEVLPPGLSEWGTICSRGWDEVDAGVACRSLGFSGVLYAASVDCFNLGIEAPPWPDTVPMHLKEVDCQGDEADLGSCPAVVFDTFPIGCFRVCLVCDDGSGTPGQVRIAGGGSSGLLEVLPPGLSEWGTVCNRGWDEVDAGVACRQLGFPGAFAASVNCWNLGVDERDTLPIWLKNVRCQGDEAELASCPFDDWQSFPICRHWNDVCLICDDGSPVSVRLTPAGGAFGEMAGRVEVNYTGVWGTISDKWQWRKEFEIVLCRELLGVPAGTPVARLPCDAMGVPALPTSVPVWFEDISCDGTEQSFLDCDFDLSNDGSDHARDVCIVCDTTVIGGDVEARLVDGPTPASGRLEVNVLDSWGTVCDYYWDKNDADVACRQLGYSGGASISQIRCSALGIPEASSSVPIWLAEMHCDGSESSLLDCGARAIGDHDCSHYGYYGGGDVCMACNDGSESLNIRLAGGATGSGRLEVGVLGTWGTVCEDQKSPQRDDDDDDEWITHNAMVACRELGFPGGVEVPCASLGISQASEDVPIWLDRVRCDGAEKSIFDCSRYLNIGDHTCDHDEDVCLQCDVPAGCGNEKRKPITGIGESGIVKKPCSWADMSNGRAGMCAKHLIARERCPLACRLCGRKDNPNPKALRHAAASRQNKKSCAWVRDGEGSYPGAWVERCSKFPEARAQCPLTCNTPLNCFDDVSPFETEADGFKTCSDVFVSWVNAIKPGSPQPLCVTEPAARKHCPVTCGSCTCSDSPARKAIDRDGDGRGDKSCKWLRKAKGEGRVARCAQGNAKEVCRQSCDCCGDNC